MREVVSNTGPIFHLYEANLLHLLPDIGSITIPNAVDEELRQLIPTWRPPSWLRFGVLDHSYRYLAHQWFEERHLDYGESEAVALSRQLQADWFLTDDRAAGRFAQSMGIEVHGGIRVILEVAILGKISQVDAHRALDDLANTSLWVSPGVMDSARLTLAELSNDHPNGG